MALIPQWGKWLDGSSSDIGYGVATDSAGNVYVTGIAGAALQSDLQTLMGSKPGSSNGVYLLKYDSSGAPLWGRWLDGSGSDIGYGVATDSIGNVYVTGQAGAALQSDLQTLMGAKPGGSNNAAFLVKYDSSGAPLWGKWLDGSGIDFGYSVATDSVGNVYVTGQGGAALQSELQNLMGSKPGGANNAAFLVKYDSSGAPLWGKWLDGSGQDSGFGVATDSSGNIYVTGQGGSDLQSELQTLMGAKPPGITVGAFLVKYDSSGAPLWGKWLDGSGTDIGYGVATDSSGNVYVTGQAAAALQSDLQTLMGSKPGTGNGAYLVKYDSSGIALWGKWLDGSASDIGFGVATDSSGNVYVTGQGGSDLQSELQTLMGSKPGGANAGSFLVKYNSSGIATVGIWLDGSNVESGRAVATDSVGNVYVTGQAGAALQSDLQTLMGSKPGGDTLSGAFLVKYLSATTPGSPTSLSVTPQNGALSVSFSAPSSNGGSAITDYEYSLDNSTWTSLITDTPTTFTVSGLPNGTTQTVYVRAVNAVGAGSASSVSGTPIAPAATHSPIEVNFNVEIEGNSAVSIFGDQFVAPSNVIIADQVLPVNALYDSVAKKGLIEFVEPSTDPDNIYVKLANTNSTSTGGDDFTDAYKVTLRQLAKGLQRVLCSEFDCSTAQPYSESKYSGVVEYTTQRDFGRVALGAFAHYLFGHVDATAAITNDVAFVKNMLSLTGSGANAAVVDETSGGAAARYAEYDSEHLTEIAGEFSAWTKASNGSASDANLAKRLVAAIVGKGFESDGVTLKETKVGDNNSADLANIVRQVVGQDAQRLMDEDNSERTKDVRRLLRFYENDVIYMNIKLKTPNVTVALGQGGVDKTGLEAKYVTEQSYTLKITLGPVETL
jgi:hypothetical protein